MTRTPYRVNFIAFIFICLGCFFSCKEKSPEDIDREVEREIAIKTVNYLIDYDPFDIEKYSEENVLHITSEKLNDNNYKTHVSHNHLKSKTDEVTIEELTINGLKVIVYYQTDLDFNLPGVFFVPDANSWRFLTQYFNNEIILNEIKTVYPYQEEGENDLPDELEF